ncbi:MAG: undecaprenyl diphosphate synthase family protein [Methanimicrococcus sp.]|nr:undecaprenyl diphosphate synthase family protein [Methanimicrococcus sp.]
MKKSDSPLETLLLILNESELLEFDDLDRLFSHFSTIQKFGVQKLIVYVDILSKLGADKKEMLCRLLKQNILKKYDSLPSNEKKIDCFVLTDYDSCAPISSSDFPIYFVLGLSGRKELQLFLTEFIENCQKGLSHPDELTPEMISLHLKLPFEPDFIILGKSTLTDFMIWQTTYSEYGFFEKEFTKTTDSELLRLLESFNKRERRFGV